ncbi:hypothetical protein TL16_g04199 [Triparma laevis f. inornata]|uniref:Intraflagellar transport protein 43 n=1 Tax=Triparma laevis f. inornata TaxID=1714386 RepID=A0A9W7ACV5_9STRA|nr:hypothetical protein TL16_g04199 [Triparma laevis f. inornata]
MSSPSESKTNESNSVRGGGFTADPEPSPPRASSPPVVQEKKPAGRRRRAGDSDDEKEEAPTMTKTEPGSKAVSGWGGDSSGGSFMKRSADNDEDGMDSSATITSGTAGNRKGRGGNKHFAEEADDIMIIPDLDEEMNDEEDITVQVAAAPRNVNRRVASLHELDSEIKYSVSSSENGVDLSLLTTSLVPQSSVQEVDEQWDFDSLLQSVTQEFHKEKEMLGEEENAPNAANADEEPGIKKQITLTPAKELKEEDARKLDELIGGGAAVPKRENVGGRRRRGNA